MAERKIIDLDNYEIISNVCKHYLGTIAYNTEKYVY